MAQAEESSVRREVFAELERIVSLDDSGRAEAESIWGETLGSFFSVQGAGATTKWRIPSVRTFGMSAVTDIATEAKRLAGAGPASKSHLRRAAVTVISKCRPPEPIDPGGCELCVNFRLP